MTVLLDENLDERLPGRFRRYEARHMASLGWAGITNGELLTRAESMQFGALLTADKNLRYQQSIVGRALALIILDIHPNNLLHQEECLPAVEDLLASVTPGTAYVVLGPHPKRRLPP